MGQACAVGYENRFENDLKCGQAKMMRKRYEWTRTLLKTEEKSYVRIRVNRA